MSKGQTLFRQPIEFFKSFHEHRSTIPISTDIIKIFVKLLTHGLLNALPAHTPLDHMHDKSNTVYLHYLIGKSNLKRIV